MIKVFLTKIYSIIFEANLLICFAIPIIIMVPSFYGLDVTYQPPTSTSGYWTYSQLRFIPLYSAYSLLLLLCQTIVPVAVVSILNNICLVKFNAIMNIRRQHYIRTQQQHFTKMTICILSISVFNNLLDFTNTLFLRLDYLDIISFTPLFSLVDSSSIPLVSPFT